MAPPVERQGVLASEVPGPWEAGAAQVVPAPVVAALRVLLVVERWRKPRGALRELLGESAVEGRRPLVERALEEAELGSQERQDARAQECSVGPGVRASDLARKSATRATVRITLSKTKRRGHRRTTGASRRPSNSSGGK